MDKVCHGILDGRQHLCFSMDVRANLLSLLDHAAACPCALRSVIDQCRQAPVSSAAAFAAASEFPLRERCSFTRGAPSRDRIALSFAFAKTRNAVGVYRRVY